MLIFSLIVYLTLRRDGINTKNFIEFDHALPSEFPSMADKINKLIQFLLVLAVVPMVIICIFLLIPTVMNNLNFVSSFIFVYFLLIGVILYATLIIFSFFSLSLIIISISISKIGVYHKLKSEKNKNGECFIVKVGKVFLWNSILTLFIFITIFDLLKPTAEITQKIPQLTNIDIAFFSALLIIPGLLLSLRLLANPVKKKSEIFFLGMLSQSNTDLDNVRLFKERILSFYFSLIAVVFIFFMVKYFYEEFRNLSDPNLVITQFVDSLIVHLPIILLSIFPYFTALILTTLIGELFLRKMEPIEQN